MKQNCFVQANEGERALYFRWLGNGRHTTVCLPVVAWQMLSGESYAKPVFPVNIAADPDVRIGVWTRVGIYTEDSVYRDQTALEHELVEMFNKREVSNASTG